MAHTTAVGSFRYGKAKLWSKTHSFQSNNFINSTLLNTGFYKSLSHIFKKSNLYLLKIGFKFFKSGVINILILYYFLIYSRLILFSKFSYSIFDPLVSSQSKDLNKFEEYKSSVLELWILKNLEFENRFLVSKKKKKLNKWLNKIMLKKNKFNKKYLILHKKFNKYSISGSNKLSRLISNRLSRNIQSNVLNSFKYSSKKRKLAIKTLFQEHIWGRFHSYKWKHGFYYDVVNILFLLCSIPNTEKLVVKFTQYILVRMHKTGVRISQFLTLLNRIINNTVNIRSVFKALRIVVSGKIFGGKARTSTKSVGFGEIPRQSINKTVNFEQVNLQSKYGEFGIRIYTFKS